MKEFKDLKLAVEYVIANYPEHAKSINVTSPLLIHLNNEEAKEESVRQLNNRGIESEYKDGIIYIKEKYQEFHSLLGIVIYLNFQKIREDLNNIYSIDKSKDVNTEKQRLLYILQKSNVDCFLKNDIFYINLENQMININNLKSKIKMNTENYIMLEGKKILLTEEQIKQIKSSVTSKPKWENFGEVKGFYIDSSSKIVVYSADETHRMNKNVFPSKEEAEAGLALSQLLQWRDKYNEDWKPDWTDTSTKYVIENYKNKIDKSFYVNAQKVLVFKTEEIRNKFLEDFADLLEIAKPLL